MDASRSTPRSLALAAWSEAGYRRLDLPSGVSVRIRIPSLETLIRREVVPSALVGMALQYATSEIKVADLDTAGIVQFLGLKDFLVAYMVRGIYGDDGEVQALDLTAAEVAELDLPSDDLDALGLVALRSRTVEEVNARTRTLRELRELGEVSPEAERVAELAREEAGPDLGPLRRERPRALRGDHGADVRRAAVGAPGDTGSSPGVPARRGARR
jgi:uncharacterized protein YceH (UPF0502 family)